MDKLRAIQYFLSAAQAGSLSAAARQQGVSLQAVAKLVSALEAQLGTRLFERAHNGLTLTVDGAQYAEACAPLVALLQAADDGLRQSKQRPQGTLVIGATPFFLQHAVVPGLPDFHASYPDLGLDARAVVHVDDAAARDCDVLLLHGWFDAGDWVRRELPVMRQVTVATPEYWRRHGMPRHPQELTRHNCLCYRNPYGKLLDLWRYRQLGGREEVIEEVVVSGWLSSNHRDHLVELVRRDAGVMRAAHATEQEALASGRLVPALLDWELMDPPPLALYYRPEHRRTLRLRVFMEWVEARCADLAQLTGGAVLSDAAGRPAWHQGNHRRASSWLNRR